MSENNQSAWSKEQGIYAVITTNKGKIVCKLEYEKAPMTVGNFIALAEGKHPQQQAKKGKPMYDGLTFHRVIDKFMVQAGDPQGNGMGGPGYKFQDEFDRSLRHNEPGVLSMANSGPNSNGSQFFITHVPTPWLDDKHTIFGNVVEGMDVVNAIKQGDSTDKVEIVRVGEAAEKFDAVHSFQNGSELIKKKTEAAMAGAKKDWENKVKAKYPDAVATPSGLYIQTDKEGTGETAHSGQTVKAHYTGTFFDSGKKFDSSVDRGTPFEFPVGKGRVIAGWDEGFAMLKVGTKGKLIIPYYLAYGEQGHPGGIPPKSDMVFEVEMLGIK